MNVVQLIGRVGKDPEVRTFNDGGKVANVTLATTERGYKLQNGTEIPEHTDWHDLRFKGGLAGIVEKYVHKGDKIAIVGKLQYRQYEKDGQKRMATEVNVEDMELLSGKSDTKPTASAPQQNNDDVPF